MSKITVKLWHEDGWTYTHAEVQPTEPSRTCGADDHRCMAPAPWAIVDPEALGVRVGWDVPAYLCHDHAVEWELAHRWGASPETSTVSKVRAALGWGQHHQAESTEPEVAPLWVVAISPTFIVGPFATESEAESFNLVMGGGPNVRWIRPPHGMGSTIAKTQVWNMEGRN